MEEKEAILRSKPEIKSWYHIEKYRVTILVVDKTKSQMLMEELFLLPQVEFAHFILHTGQNDSLILTNELIVKLTPVIAIEEIKSQYQTELLREDPFDDVYKVLKVYKGSQFNAIEIANSLAENGTVIYACPNFIRKIEIHKEPDDEYYSQQWVLPKIGTPLAWDYTTGSSNVKIAIIDGGVDLGHPDLQNAITTGYDAVDNDNTPQCNPTDGHGTCCAGIAAAVTNNNEGIAGVAGGWGVSGGCKILPIRISSFSSGWISDDEIKFCFNWATNQGAKIFSNSWGTGYIPSAPIFEGIKYAINHNCLVFFASGNTYSHVMWPAQEHECIAVGATNQSNLRWDYSAHDRTLDICAPQCWYGWIAGHLDNG